MVEATEADNFFLILVDGIDDTQRELIHFQIDKRSKGWWHQSQNVWVVKGGRDPLFWTNHLGSIVPKSPSILYVFSLPEPGNRYFASFAPKGEPAWLLANYAESDVMEDDA